MTKDFSADASAFLLDLAHGKYADEVAKADMYLTILGSAQPWALVVKQIMDTMLKINTATAPLQVVPDGRGGWVPSTNSRIGPDGNFL